MQDKTTRISLAPLLAVALLLPLSGCSGDAGEQTSESEGLSGTTHGSDSAATSSATSGVTAGSTGDSSSATSNASASAGSTDGATCGDGVVEADEACDGGECCTPGCALVADATPCVGGECQAGVCEPEPEPSVGPACLEGLFSGTPGELAELTIPIDFNGRPAIGDLDGDGFPDFVISRRDRIAGYTTCGEKLWDLPTQTNWDFPGHYFWNLTTYGYIGDADGDGAPEFLHIGGDWRTLLVYDGATGALERTIPLPGGADWMYVMLGRRADDRGDAATRVVVAGPAYASHFNVAAYDLRADEAAQEWAFSQPMGAAISVYLTPQAADLDGQGGDEIFYGTLALRETGEKLWQFDVGGMSQLSAIHASTVADIDPARPGLEAVHSVYAPHNGQPSLVAYGPEVNDEIWRTYSPHSELHPHQHAVGDFDVDRPGLEVLARNANGLNHWMTDAQGAVIRPNWRVPPGWENAGEYVQTIYWDAEPGAEVLYLERHVSNDGVHAIRSRMVVVSPADDSLRTPVFAGGVMEDTRTWTGVSDQEYFNPYEGAGLVVDMIGDGREEIFTWGDGAVTIVYNTGDAGVPRRWADTDYQIFKKISCYLYSPR